MPSFFWLLVTVFAAAVYVTTWLVLFVHRDDPQALRALVFPTTRQAQELRWRASAREAAGGDSVASLVGSPFRCSTPLQGFTSDGATTPSSQCDAGFFHSALSLASGRTKTAAALLLASRLQLESTPPGTPPRSRSAANELVAEAIQEQRRSRSRSYLRRAVSYGRPSRAVQGRSLWMGSAGEDGAMVETTPEAAASRAKHSKPVHECGSGDRLVTNTTGTGVENSTVTCSVPNCEETTGKPMTEYNNAEKVCASGALQDVGRNARRCSECEHLGNTNRELDVSESGGVESSFRHTMMQLQGDVITTEEECSRLRRNIAFITAARQELRMEEEMLQSSASSNSYSSCSSSVSDDSSENMVMAEDAVNDDVVDVAAMNSDEMEAETGLADANKKKEFSISEMQPALWLQMNAEKPVTYVE